MWKIRGWESAGSASLWRSELAGTTLGTINIGYIRTRKDYIRRSKAYIRKRKGFILSFCCGID